MLGTDEIPPPLRRPWQMWSTSSDPYQNGLIQFEFTEEGLAVGWFPDAKQLIPWHELAWGAGTKSPDLNGEVEWVREQAQAEGYRLAKKQFIEDMRGKVTKIGLMLIETDNPFLAKYAEKLKELIVETEASLV